MYVLTKEMYAEILDINPTSWCSERGLFWMDCSLELIRMISSKLVICLSGGNCVRKSARICSRVKGGTDGSTFTGSSLMNSLSRYSILS